MALLLEIVHIIFPIIFVGIVVIFVIHKIKSKSIKGTLGKKRTQQAQTLLDSLIPLGMLLGLLFAILSSLFFSISLLSAIPIGAAIGLLIGYVAYEIYSRVE
ncbi:hypothetical protein [Marinilactibacillus kalidii]|uniref:hypothetical protein n=1 Tax=Marinilactibacillus kalidii TaxID=2820274 RepID=UPI001ABDEF7C|nr:hypothetical protein [Marinilactibacillus kalidii]